jgi:hypothetical protein
MRIFLFEVVLHFIFECHAIIRILADIVAMKLTEKKNQNSEDVTFANSA